MTRLSPLHLTALLLATASPLPAAAQPGAIVQPLTPNADRLSEQMRILGRSPNDVSALVEAGRLSGKLGDTDAAMQFLARAEKVAPNDPRIRAARGVALVGMERPGEALALFASAERAGVNMTPYLAERGLAYDLLGRGSLAQADYRQALRAGDDDEITRRLALSLGIDGDVTGSTAVLNPLLQKGDRAAWRVRAFVLAMSGDAAGADKVTASVLPGFSASLSPFFRRLPQLAGADRAFAVHYGRLVPSPERLADARLAPALPAPVRTAPPVALASATTAAPAATARTTARPSTYAERRAERQRQAAAAVAAQTEATRRAADARAQQLAQAQAAQAEATRRAADARAQQLAQAQADETARRAALAQRQLAAQQAEQARLAEATRVEAQRVAARQTEERRVAAEALASRDRAEQAARAPVQVASAPVPVTLVDRPAEATAPAPAPVAVASNAAPAPTPPTATPAVSSAAATVAARTESNDDVLARIIRNLDIPASELGVGPPPAPVAATSTLAAEAEAARRAATAREATARAAEAAEAKKAATARAATAKKAAEAKRIADEKKAAAAEAAREAQVKRADPERHWVQVAGGANVAGLPAAWGIMAGKAPELKGRQAWTTPLRATNRLLTGPFKSDAEAQDFVNTLRKSGVQAFTFTSEAGQKVARVPVK
jgi:hypothetical protein